MKGSWFLMNGGRNTQPKGSDVFRQQKGEFTAVDAHSSFDKTLLFVVSFVWKQEDRMLLLPLSKEINVTLEEKYFWSDLGTLRS